MARVDMPPEHLTDYERAICYYTLPKITHPVTFGLLAAYVVCLIETLGVLAYGMATHHPGVTRIGIFALGGIVVFGIVAFMLRALFHEFRKRKALATARGMPDVSSGAEDIPDPFENHLLLRHPLHARGDLFPCTDDAGDISYFVESAVQSPWWKVKDAHDNEVLRVHVQSEAASFSLGGGVPSRLSVFVEGEEAAQINRRFSLTSPATHVVCTKPEPREYVVREESIFRGNRLVGRIYYLHQSAYLDIERDEFHLAILGLFITMP
ncbi:MAG: hypothetical protein GWP08_04790 [Nitrospiraceae bacterium]|nr:hypothetical protein [Nitrospiraceae bacterium]